jgi:predicted nucleotidyltransferase
MIGGSAESHEVDRTFVARTLLHEELARFVRILEPRPGTEKVILFGSLARDEASEGSDIDLLVVEKTALSFWKRLREIRRILQPRVATDLLVYTPEELDVLSRERPFVRDEILAKGRILYERHA